MKKCIAGIIIIILMILPFTSVTASETEQKIPNILILLSYHYGFEWQDQVLDGVTDALADEDANLYIEYLNEYQLGQLNTNQQIYEALSGFYDNVSFDCVIVTDDYAYSFISEYYEVFTPGVPVVFMGLNDYSPEMLFTDNITGLPQTIDRKGLIELTEQLNPGYSELVLLFNNTLSSKIELNAYEEVLTNHFPDLKYQLITAKNFDEVAARIAPIDDAQFIMVENFPQPDGTLLKPSETVALLIETKNSPFYTDNRLQLTEAGNSPLGGLVMDPYEMANEAGNLSKEVLAGTKPSELHISTEPVVRYVFNYKLLTEYDINDNRLPPNSEIIGRPDTRIFINRNVAIAAAIILVLSLALIMILLFVIRLNARDQAIILKANQELDVNRRILEEQNRTLHEQTQRVEEQNIELGKKNQEITMLLNKDPVTRFLNRKVMEQLLKDMSESLVDYVLYGIHINNLTFIEELYGYHQGDTVRWQISQLIGQLFRDPNTEFCRYHDNFYIFDYNTGATGDMIHKADELLKLLNRTLTIEKNEVEISATIGLLSKSDINTTDTNLLGLVDITLSENIDKRLNKVTRFNERFEHLLKRRLQLEVELKKAIKEGEFELYFQPVISTEDNHVSSAEALIRWNKNGALVSPGEFIPAAESLGIIEDIGEWVIFEVGAHVKRLKEQNLQCPIAINVSSKQMNRRLIHHFTKLLQNPWIQPYDLTIEVTESVLIADLENKKELLEDLSKMGIKIALDDFGTGYSSMKYIQQLPLSKLKIDKHFIDNITSTRQQAIVKSIFLLGKTLSLETIAEGVETTVQYDIVKSIGFSNIQGWYFSKALPFEAFVAYLTQQ